MLQKITYIEATHNVITDEGYDNCDEANDVQVTSVDSSVVAAPVE